MSIKAGLQTPGSPFLFLAPPTPSAGRLFTPVRTGVAASPQTAKSTSRSASSTVRRRQEVRYYGVGFGQRNTPVRRGAALRGPSTVRGNAARPQSSLFESMDIQPTSPVQDFGKPADFSSSVAQNTDRPTVWTTALGENADNGMKVDEGSGAGSAALRPVQFGSGSSSGGTADILRNIIKETSPQGKGGSSARPSGARPVPQNPYMVTGNESTVSAVSLPAVAPQVSATGRSLDCDIETDDSP